MSFATKNEEVLFRRQLFPKPANEKPVGFAKFCLIDASRMDRFNKGFNKQFEILVWYPCIKGTGSHVKGYLDGHSPANLVFLRRKCRDLRLFAALTSGATNAEVNAVVSDVRDRYPILLFSHDLQTLPEYYTCLMEHLASEGYVVFSINHPSLSEEWHSTAADIPYPRHVNFKRTIGWRWKFALLKARRILNAKTYDKKWAISKEVLPQMDKLAEINADMTADRTFLLHFLSQMDTGTTFYEHPISLFIDRLDVKNVGCFGHGWGGASAVHSLVSDSRIKVAINLDGFQLNKIVMHNIIDKPLLVIYSEEFSEINKGIYFSSAELESYTLRHSDHLYFTDFLHFDILKKAANPDAFYHTLNLVVHFFDKYLKNTQYQFVRQNARS